MFNKAITDAFQWSSKWYFGSFSTAIATFYFFEKYLEFDTFRSFRYGIAIFIVSFLVKALWQYIKYIDELESKLVQKEVQIDNLQTKKERQKQLSANNFYGDAIITLKDSFSKIHYLRKQQNVQPEAIITIMVSFCNQLKAMFEKRYKYTYSVCIKGLVFVEGTGLSETEIVTICRDENSYRKRSQPATVKHKISDNTCYFEVLSRIESTESSFYSNNDLPEDKYYKNSSFKIWGELPNDLGVDERREKWTLPYKSEIVVPISPLVCENNSRNQEFLGYLCVDCDTEYAFHRKYDVEMLQGIADGIYDILKNHLTSI